MYRRFLAVSIEVGHGVSYIVKTSHLARNPTKKGGTVRRRGVCVNKPMVQERKIIERGKEFATIFRLRSC